MSSRLKTGVGIAGLTALGVSAVAVITDFEGIRTKPYYDQVGVLTVCVGETQGVKRTDRYTVEQCKAMLVRRLDPYEAGVRKCLKAPDAVPDGAYVASISLAYNVGLAAYCGSTVRRKLDAGDLRGACDAFLRFNKAGGVYNQGLANRRAAERKICLGGLK